MTEQDRKDAARMRQYAALAGIKQDEAVERLAGLRAQRDGRNDKVRPPGPILDALDQIILATRTEVSAWQDAAERLMAYATDFDRHDR